MRGNNTEEGEGAKQKRGEAKRIIQRKGNREGKRGKEGEGKEGKKNEHEDQEPS